MLLTPTQEIQKRIQNKQFPDAEKLIADGLTLEPDNADFFYLRGLLRSYQNRLVESIEDLRKALYYDPKHTDSAICLSVILNDIGRYEEAKKIFEQANQSVFLKQIGDDVQIDRRFSVKHFEVGDLYFRYRRFDEAIEEYNKAILLDPQSTDIRVKRAKAFAKKGFITRAIQELQQLKAERPTDLTIRIQLGLLHYSQSNLLDAEIEWESVLELDPVNREATAYLDLIKKEH
ncbi:MAG: tetratricopeptide repeat protein [Bdellovibrionales bacterium]|nr:tetratricopeptide repeat protein [Bdellovibrionales bacterium]